MTDNFEESENSETELASSEPHQNLKFQREDWNLFRTLEGLQQRAGVTKDKLRRLVLKELADNGLDNGGDVQVGNCRTAVTSLKMTAAV